MRQDRAGRFKWQLRIAVIVARIVIIGDIMHHHKIEERNRMVLANCFRIMF